VTLQSAQANLPGPIDGLGRPSHRDGSTCFYWAGPLSVRQAALPKLPGPAGPQYWIT
jgi:hypothetical protein